MRQIDISDYLLGRITQYIDARERYLGADVGAADMAALEQAMVDEAGVIAYLIASNVDPKRIGAIEDLFAAELCKRVKEWPHADA